MHWLNTLICSQKNNCVSQICSHICPVLTEDQFEMGKNSLDRDLRAWKCADEACHWLNQFWVEFNDFPDIGTRKSSHLLDVLKAGIGFGWYWPLAESLRKWRERRGRLVSHSDLHLMVQPPNRVLRALALRPFYPNAGKRIREPFWQCPFVRHREEVETLDRPKL